jgi:hypothetical protein
MPTPLEREIGALLRETADPQAVGAQLRQRWAANLLSLAEQKTAAFFLLRAGMTHDALEELARRLGEGATIPWPAMAEALATKGIMPDAMEAEAIAIGCEAQGAMHDLLASPAASDWGAAFVAKRAEVNSRRALELEDKRAQLWDAARFMRANRLHEQESKALAEIRALFPDDPEFASQNQSLQERWAREIIAQGHGGRGELTREEAMREAPLDAEQAAARQEISRQAIHFARARPEMAVDFALLLHFMEFRPEALEALDASGIQSGRGASGGAPSLPRAAAKEASGKQDGSGRSPSRDWLRLELLLLARKFVAALEEANRLEIAYSDTPEAAFSVAYARAHALWGLGERAMAIDLMRNIVHVRPGYRSAQSLLLDWSGGSDA